MATKAPGRLNPTLFDKLVSGNNIRGMRGAELDDIEQRQGAMALWSVPQVERFNEAALRATVRRELSWLLNSTNLEAAVDLEPYPEVKSSVINYGVPDLSGAAMNHRLLVQRAREIRTAIERFEPRIDPESVDVELAENTETPNAITYVIHADVRSAVRAIPVKLYTDLEPDSSAATVRE